MHKAHRAVALAVLLTGATPLFACAQSEGRSAAAATKDTVWVYEEAWFLPLRYDAVDALAAAQTHFQRNEERTAANELASAVSWLRFAAHHAQPITKTKLEEASRDLERLSMDLKEGRVVTARSLDAAIARASHALAEWHVFKANEQIGKHEELYAAQHVEAAARHLRQAAISARYTIRDEATVAIQDIDEYGADFARVGSTDMRRLSRDLGAIEAELGSMAQTLRTGSR